MNRSDGTNTSAASADALQTAQRKSLALFASDLHLHPSLPKTVDAFLCFLRQHAAHTENLYLLGDLFEYWAGDDDLGDPFNLRIASELRNTADTGVAIFWIAGNRDFLIGEKFAAAAKLTLLPDPYVNQIGAHKIVLTHGDILCTDDVSYMEFRKQVRTQSWQDGFLARSLEERKSIIEGLRNGSKEAQRMKAADIMDTNEDAVIALFKSTNALLMIHGHTHRPAKHVIEGDGKTRVRMVLPDWDCDVQPARGGWLGIDAANNIHCYDFAGNVLER